MPDINSKSLFVSVIGEPNVGKSTLVNTIIGEKISIVSPRVQTTRRHIRGIFNVGETQLIFTDTPGFFANSEKRSRLESLILCNFWSSFRSSDIILLLIDSTAKNHSFTFNFLEKLRESGEHRVLIAINKVDIANKKDILQTAESLVSFDFVEKVFMISAVKNDGVADIVEYLIKIATIGPRFFEINQSTDADMKFRLSEITREKLFLALDKELPYSIYVETEFFVETEKKTKVYQSIVVLKDSQKAIVIGKEGSMLRFVRNSAVADMKKMLKKRLELKLFVKVREKWTAKKRCLQDAGIVIV
jgi:GTP-binding protein Era